MIAGERLGLLILTERLASDHAQRARVHDERPGRQLGVLADRRTERPVRLHLDRLLEVGATLDALAEDGRLRHQTERLLLGQL